MINRIIEQIGRRARVEHGGDWSKAATEFFRDHPEEWQSYAEEVTEVNKRAGEDPNYVNALVRSRIEMVAYRDNLDLAKPADVVVAQEKALVENPDLFKRYIAANTIHVGKVSLITGDE
jgi:hypothetical protein